MNDEQETRLRALKVLAFGDEHLDDQGDERTRLCERCGSRVARTAFGDHLQACRNVRAPFAVQELDRLLLAAIRASASIDTASDADEGIELYRLRDTLDAARVSLANWRRKHGR